MPDARAPRLRSGRTTNLAAGRPDTVTLWLVVTSAAPMTLARPGRGAVMIGDFRLGLALAHPVGITCRTRQQPYERFADTDVGTAPAALTLAYHAFTSCGSPERALESYGAAVGRALRSCWRRLMAALCTTVLMGNDKIGYDHCCVSERCRKVTGGACAPRDTGHDDGFYLLIAVNMRAVTFAALVRSPGLPFG